MLGRGRVVASDKAEGRAVSGIAGSKTLCNATRGKKVREMDRVSLSDKGKGEKKEKILDAKRRTWSPETIWVAVLELCRGMRAAWTAREEARVVRTTEESIFGRVKVS